MGKYQLLHLRALQASENFKRSERELLDVLQEVDVRRAYVEYGCNSLFQYCVTELDLTEAVAFQFIVVARKATELPALKEAIDSGKLSVSKARKITPVLDHHNVNDLLEFAAQATSRQIEKKVASINPILSSYSRARYTNEEMVNIDIFVSEKVYESFERARSLISNRKQGFVAMEEALEHLVDQFLKRNDPLKKDLTTRRSHLPVPGQVLTRYIPESSHFAVMLRDEARCQFVLPNGKKCLEDKFIRIHHIKPLYEGGDHGVDNLITLCSGHHDCVHKDDKLVNKYKKRAAFRAVSGPVS